MNQLLKNPVIHILLGMLIVVISCSTRFNFSKDSREGLEILGWVIIVVSFFKLWNDE